MATIGPRVAAGIGVGAVAATNYSDDLRKYMQSSWGGDGGLAVPVGADASHKQIVRSVNRQLDAAMGQLRDFVRAETRGAGGGGGWAIRHGAAWPRVSPLLLLKVLCAAGVVFGVLRLCGYGLADLYLVPRRSIAQQLQVLEETVKEVQDRVEHQFKDLMGIITSYQEEISGTQEEMQGAVGAMDTEVGVVREHVTGVAEATTHMERKVVGTARGIQLLCQVVADNFPQTAAQNSLRTFAQDSIRATEELERAAPPSLAGRLLGRLIGSAPAAVAQRPEG